MRTCSWYTVNTVFKNINRDTYTPPALVLSTQMCLNDVTFLIWGGAERNQTIIISLNSACFQRRNICIWQQFPIYLLYITVTLENGILLLMQFMQLQSSLCPHFLQTCIFPHKQRFPHFLFSCFLIWTWKKHYMLFPHKAGCCDKPLNQYDDNTEQQWKETFLLSSYHILASER